MDCHNGSYRKAGITMAFENLTEREKQILANLINHYILSADPVGSRAIANRFQMGISSATIRNTLQDLEELGLVEQPHTSAGRIPTDQGYRVYVDYLLQPEQLSEVEKEAIRGRMLKEGRGIREILGQTAKLLGDITHQLGVTIAPRFESGVLKDLRLIPVSEGRLMVVVIVESGLARSVILEVEVSLSDRILAEVEACLNERLRGLTLLEIRSTVSARLADIPGNARLLQLVIDSRDKIWTESSSEDLLIAGQENLLLQPEFVLPERLAALMRLVQDPRGLASALGHAHEEDLVISIGRENTLHDIIGCSLVTASYRVGNIAGAVGIVGPTRMPYNKAVSIVEYTAKSITEVLSG
ncbi:MAG: heat-inducible transcriptional repressor HrcA, partial [candidate division Zixibacteria bacterium]|nr:heat-inducible transcriptional repressor HrcA [candidate division Zixibacteria bacterium]